MIQGLSDSVVVGFRGLGLGERRKVVVFLREQTFANIFGEASTVQRKRTPFVNVCAPHREEEMREEGSETALQSGLRSQSAFLYHHSKSDQRRRLWFSADTDFRHRGHRVTITA